MQCCFWGEYAKHGITWVSEEGAKLKKSGKAAVNAWKKLNNQTGDPGRTLMEETRDNHYSKCSGDNRSSESD
jgi:hypothetical protein